MADSQVVSQLAAATIAPRSEGKYLPLSVAFLQIVAPTIAQETCQHMTLQTMRQSRADVITIRKWKHLGFVL